LQQQQPNQQNNNKETTTMGFIRNLFTTGGGGADDNSGQGATSSRAQNVWRSVFNPGSPAQRGKGSAQWADKPGAHQGSVMDEIVGAPSIQQATVAGTAPAASSSPAATPRPSLDAAAQRGTKASEPPHEFGGMDKHGFGA
jgi:hypothetical protein